MSSNSHASASGATHGTDDDVAAKKAFRERIKLQRMTPERRELYFREQAAKRKAEQTRDRAKADAAKQPSMLELVERFEAVQVPHADGDVDTGTVHHHHHHHHHHDNDGDDDDDGRDDVRDVSTSKRKRSADDADNDDDDAVGDASSSSAAAPAVFDKAAFERHFKSKQADIERELSKLRAALKPGRFYDAQLEYIEKRKKQIEGRLRAEFIKEQRDKLLDKRQKLRYVHQKRTDRGQPVMRTMINDMLQKLQKSDLATPSAPHLYVKAAPKPVTPAASAEQQKRRKQQQEQQQQQKEHKQVLLRAPRTGSAPSKARVNQ
jgi:hypothetical protein